MPAFGRLAREHRERGRAARPRPARRAGSTSMRSSSPPSTIATPGKPGVGDEQVRAAPDDQHRDVGLRRPSTAASAAQVVLALDPHEHRERAAAAVGRRAGPTARRARPGRGERARRARPTRLGDRVDVTTPTPSQTSGIVVRSPAPRVSTRSPGARVPRGTGDEIGAAAGGTRPAARDGGRAPRAGSTRPDTPGIGVSPAGRRR